MKKQSTREKLLDIAFEEVYIHGYNATSVDAILKRALVPKGSMYHYFKSKKSLVMAMIEERLYPKMDDFFDFRGDDSKLVTQNIRDTLLAISKNKLLVTYGCPLYRLMVEMSAVDKDFDLLLTSKAKQMQEDIEFLLDSGIKKGEFSKDLDAKNFSKFILSRASFFLAGAIASSKYPASILPKTSI